MPLISNTDEIKRGSNCADIIGRRVPLRQARGSHLEGSCPFHRSASGRSFHVYPDKNCWYCWGCHEGGSVISFLMKFENCDYPTALEIAASESRIEVKYDTAHATSSTAITPVNGIPRQDLNAAIETACQWYQAKLFEKTNAAALEYMRQRGFTDAMLRKYRIGYAYGSSVINCADTAQHKEALKAAGVLQENEKEQLFDPLAGRITIPILDNAGRPCGFTGRIIDPTIQAAKYKNTRDTPIFSKGRTLFGWSHCRDMYKSISNAPRQLYIIEGQLKAIAMIEAGLPCVAAGGTGFTDQQIAMISRLSPHVAILPDPDQAGYNAAIRTARELRKFSVTVTMAELDRSQKNLKDPDDFMANSLPIRLMPEMPFIDWLYTIYIGKHPVQTLDQAKIVSETIVPVIREHPMPAARILEARTLARLSGISEAQLMDNQAEQLPVPPQATDQEPPQIDPTVTPDRELVAAILQYGPASNPEWVAGMPLAELPSWLANVLQEVLWIFRYATARNLPLLDAIEEATPPARRPWYTYWAVCSIDADLTPDGIQKLTESIIEENRNQLSMQAAKSNLLDFSSFIQNWR